MSKAIQMVTQDGKFYVSSLEFSRKIGKRHDNVLRDIDLLKSQDGEDLLNFEEISYLDKYEREQKMYLLGRTELSVLLSRLQGEDALQWTIRFFSIWNAKEEEREQKLKKLEEREARRLNASDTLRVPSATKVLQEEDAHFDLDTDEGKEAAGELYLDKLKRKFPDQDIKTLLKTKIRFHAKCIFNNIIATAALELLDD